MTNLIWYVGLLLVGLALGAAWRARQWRAWRKAQPKPAEFKIKL